MSTTKIFLATPAYGNTVYATYMRSVLNAIGELAKHGVECMFYTIGNESLVTRARNNCVAQFLNTDCTHLLFIDSDIEFGPDLIPRLLKFNKDIACACYPLKTVVWDNVKSLTQAEIQSMTSEQIQNHLMKYNVQVTKDKFYKRPVIDGFMQVDYAATGFMLIKRTVITKMKKLFADTAYKDIDMPENLKDKTFALFDTMIDEDKYYLSEDWTFCKRWKQIGGEIWLDLVSPLTHNGAFAFRGCVASSMKYTS